MICKTLVGCSGEWWKMVGMVSDNILTQYCTNRKGSSRGMIPAIKNKVSLENPSWMGEERA